MAEQDEPQRLIIDSVAKLDAWNGDVAAWNEWGAEHGGEDFEPLDPDQPVFPVLRGGTAAILWRKGRDEWHQWVDANPRADIDFSTQTFNEKEVVDFRDFHFPEGLVSFQKCRFERGLVDFTGADFGKGDVNFNRSAFSARNVVFHETTFGEGQVSFAQIYGSHANFNFSGANFGDGDFHFFGSEFRHNNIDFTEATFGLGTVDCSDVTFGIGTLDFTETDMGKGDVNFSGSNFAEKYVIFQETQFHGGDVDFSNCEFGKPARFDGLSGMEKLTKFSFEGTACEKLFTFSHDGRMGCPLDLRRTKLAHNPVLHDVHCTYRKAPKPGWLSRTCQSLFGRPLGKEPAFPWLPPAADREDSQRFRRLKEIANTNRNHAKALEFHILEMRSKRGWETSPIQDCLQFFYWLLGNYGKSVTRPIIGLFASLLAFATIFHAFRTQPDATFSTAFNYSLSHTLAFIPTGRTARTQGEELLFGVNSPTPNWAIGLGALESILAVILLFLLGLGLRNLYRV